MNRNGIKLGKKLTPEQRKRLLNAVYGKRVSYMNLQTGKEEKPHVKEG